jgi:hypothetical protein
MSSQWVGSNRTATVDGNGAGERSFGFRVCGHREVGVAEEISPGPVQRALRSEVHSAQ